MPEFLSFEEEQRLYNDYLSESDNQFANLKLAPPVGFSARDSGCFVSSNCDIPSFDGSFNSSLQKYMQNGSKRSFDEIEDSESVETARKRSPPRFTAQEVSLSDAGDLFIDAKFIIKYDTETMDLIKKLKLDLTKLRVLTSGYLCVAGQRLNCLLAGTLKQEHFQHLVSCGFDGNIEDLDHVSHNDGNAFNNNVSNLLNMPLEWNLSLKKPKGAQLAQRKMTVKYWQKVVISESTPHNTLTAFDDADEALFHYDVLKIHHSINDIKLCPKLAQELIFKFGLIRPAKFVQMGCYSDIATLSSYYDKYEALRRSSNRRGQTHVKSDRFRLLSLGDSDVHSDILAALNVPGNLPFDEDQHVVFEYCGVKRRYQRICNRDIYESIVKQYTGGVGEVNGYLNFNDLGYFHNLALGRSRGEHKKDKLEGCHGVGGILDNRVNVLEDGRMDQRTLTLGSVSANSSHINRKTDNSSSRYPGVRWYTKDQKWRAEIRFNGLNVLLGSFVDELEAAEAYRKVQSRRGEVEMHLVGVEEAEERRRIIKSFL